MEQQMADASPTVPLTFQQLKELFSALQLETGRRKELSELDEFKGEKQMLQPWLIQAKEKLSIDLASKSERIRVAYLAGRLREDAQKKMAPWLETCEAQNKTVEEFYRQLELLYGDPMKARRAHRELEEMRMGKRSFADHYALWQAKLIEANGMAWADTVKRGYLMRTLTSELRDAMASAVALGSLDRFDQLVAALHRVDEQRAENKGYDRLNRPPFTQQSSQFSVTSPNLESDAMDWEPTPAQVAPARTSNGARRRAKFVNNEEMAKRRKNGWCLRCGDSTHRIRDCPYLPPRRPLGKSPPTHRVSAALLEEEEEDKGRAEPARKEAGGKEAISEN